MFGHLEKSAFETPAGKPLSQDRRALQRILVNHLTELAVTPEAGTPAEASQVAAATLRSIGTRMQKSLAAGKLDGYTRAHYQDLATKVRRTLEAEMELPVAGK
jgi:hypothetical protein